jgi:hypothetical protein
MQVARGRARGAFVNAFALLPQYRYLGPGAISEIWAAPVGPLRAGSASTLSAALIPSTGRSVEI